MRLCFYAIIVSLFICSISTAHAAKRVALVIGNSKYEHAGALKNPSNDAADIADALMKLDFEVHKGFDLDKSKMDRLIRQFANSLAGADVGLFFLCWSRLASWRAELSGAGRCAVAERRGAGF